MLTIITVTKDDIAGLLNTIKSTKDFREKKRIRQIIVDGSAGSAGDHIRKLIEHESNIEYIWQDPSGIAAAFNLGLSLVETKWVWFLNGRDEIHPDIEPDMLLYIIEKSESDAIIFEHESMQSRQRYKHPPMWAMWPPVFFWIPHPATIIKCELFNKYGFFNEQYKIAMDGEIWFRFFSRNVIVDMISIPIALYDEGGISRVQKGRTAKESIKIIGSYAWMIFKMWIANGKSIYNATKRFYKISRQK